MDTSIAKNLSQLLSLQAIDVQLDDIIKLRGSLPQEVISLEVELSKLQEHVSSTQEVIDHLETTVRNKKVEIKEKEVLIQKYTEQQMNVRNNREYDAIAKEIELNKLDIQLTEKIIRTSYEQLERNKHIVENTKDSIKKNETNLLLKKDELTVIIATASESEEQELHKKRQKIIEALEVSLYVLYERIRRNMHNKLAVVTVKRNACGGCCIIIPPQTRIEIQEKNKINTCEHCSRIIADVDEAAVA